MNQANTIYEPPKQRATKTTHATQTTHTTQKYTQHQTHHRNNTHQTNNLQKTDNIHVTRSTRKQHTAHNQQAPHTPHKPPSTASSRSNSPAPRLSYLTPIQQPDVVPSFGSYQRSRRKSSTALNKVSTLSRRLLACTLEALIG